MTWQCFFAAGQAAWANFKFLFDDFALVSGLELNLPKTVLVPLDPYDEPAIRAIVIREAPGWGVVAVASFAKKMGKNWEYI